MTERSELSEIADLLRQQNAPKEPWFDRRLSMGNVWTIIVAIGTAIWTAATTLATAGQHSRDIEALQEQVKTFDGRAFGRVEEAIAGLKVDVSKVNERLDRLILERKR